MVEALTCMREVQCSIPTSSEILHSLIFQFILIEVLKLIFFKNKILNIFYLDKLSQ